MVLGRRGPTPSKLAPQPWWYRDCSTRVGFEARGGEGGFSAGFLARTVPLKTSVATPCGLAWNCTLVVGSPSLAADLSAFYSLLLSLFCSAFSPFSPCRRTSAVGEADSLAPGKALYQAGRTVSSPRKSMLWGMSLASQSQLSSCVSGHRQSVLAQGAPCPPEMTGGGSVWGRREQACRGD